MKKLILNKNTVLGAFVLFIISISLINTYSGLKLEKEKSADQIINYRDKFLFTQRHDISALQKALYSLFDHPDIWVRRNILEAIGEMNEKNTLDLLMKEYKKYYKRNSLKKAVVTALCEYNRNYPSKKGRQILTDIFLNDDEAAVRHEALQGAFDTNDKEFLPYFQKAYQTEKDLYNRYSIALFLVDFGQDEYLKDLYAAIEEYPYTELRSHIAEKLGELDSNQKKNLKELWKKEQDIFVKIPLAGGLVRNGDQDGLDFIRQTIQQTNDIYVKSAAVRMLVELRYLDEAYPFLLELLKEGDESIRELVFEDLEEYVDYPIEPVLKQTLLNDPSKVVREIAAWVLGQRKNRSGLPYLEQALYDEDPFVRTGAAVAIYKILTHQDQTNK